MRTRSAFYVFSLLLFVLSPRAALSGTTASQARSVQEALSVPLGTSVSLKGVFVDKATGKPPYIVVREPWAAGERIVVLLSGAPGVSLQQTIDVTGSITLLRNGYRAIENAGIFAYTDRAGKVIKCPLPSGPSADSTVDITPAPSVSTARSDMSLMSEETPPAPDPGPTPTEPDYLIDMIADTESIADGATVRINGKAISGTGTDPVYGPYFIAAEDGSTETIRAYTPEAATTSDRAVTLQGTLSTDSNGNKELSIGSGPATPPEGFLAQVLLAEIVTVAGAKASPDAPAATVALNNQVVTRCFPTQGLFYVRESDRSAGIRVKNATMASQLQPGDTVSFSGTMKSEGFERYVDVTSPATGESGAPPNPLTTINRSIGGADGPYNAKTGAGQKGVIGGSGLNNIGQLVRTTGKVAGVGLGFFYIDDGSALDDTTGHGKGLRVSLAWQTTGETPMEVPAAGAYVTVTGISSCEHVGFDSSNNPRLMRVIRVRAAGDVVLQQVVGIPAYLQAVASGKEPATQQFKISLYWQAVPGATGYRVYRGTTSGGQDYSLPLPGPTPVPTYTGSPTYIFNDVGVSAGQTYYYTVRALKGVSEGQPSIEDSATPSQGGIPWDTGDPSVVLPALQAAFPDDNMELQAIRALGPDGRIYEFGYPSALPPDGVVNSSGEVTLQNGTKHQLPRDYEREDDITVQLQQLTDPNNGHTGPYRRVLTRASGSYRAVSGRFRLPDPTVGNRETPYAFTTSQGATESTKDRAHLYLGASVTVGSVRGAVEIDAGIWFDTTFGPEGRWRMFQNINSRWVNMPPGGWFEGGQDVRATFSVSAVEDDLVLLQMRTLDGNVIPLPAAARGVRKNAAGCRMKRAHSIAQDFVGPLPEAYRLQPDYSLGYRQTGSYFLASEWHDGQVRPVGGVFEDWGTQHSDAADAVGFPASSGIVSWSNNPVTQTQRYARETVNIDL